MELIQTQDHITVFNANLILIVWLCDEVAFFIEGCPYRAYFLQLLKTAFDPRLGLQQLIANFSEEFSVPKEGVVFPINLKIESAEYIGETEKNLIYVASEKLNFPLKLRKWERGDSFHPFGMKGKKKLSKFFKDEKIPLTEKEKIWLLLSDEKIVWVIGHRMDDRFKVTKDSKKILKITWND